MYGVYLSYDTCFMCFCLGTKTDENVYEGNGETGKSRRALQKVMMS